MKADDELGANKKGAKALATKLIKDSNILTAPVSLYQIIQFLQASYSLHVVPINTTEKVSGLLVVCKKEETETVGIAFNENDPWCRRRFTISHEIGHLLLGHTCTEGSGTTNETEANIFASELLMPISILKGDYSRIKKIPELAKLYRVSQQAMSYRLMDSKLLKL